MASLTSGSITIGYPSGDRGMDTSITNRKKLVNLKLTIASGEYPAAGVQMPSAGSVGMVRNLDYYTMSPRLATASGRAFFFTLTTGHKLRAVAGRLTSGNGTALLALATTVTVSSKIIFVTAHGW